MAVLAGGLGTRLGRLTADVPKSLLDVAGKPFLLHQLDTFRRHGIERVVLCVGHLGERIRERLGPGPIGGIRLIYSFDGPRCLGTAGALKRARDHLGAAFFVCYGDSYLDIDYRRVQETFESAGRLGLMTLYRNRGQYDRSNVVYRDGRILTYDKNRPLPEMEHIDYGLGVLAAGALDRIPEDRPFDLADVYRDLLRRGQLAAYENANRFYEIGSPEGLAETRELLAKTTVEER